MKIGLSGELGQIFQQQMHGVDRIRNKGLQLRQFDSAYSCEEEIRNYSQWEQDQKKPK